MSEILNSLQKVNEELTAIEKNQKGYGYKFRGIDQVLNTLSPLFKKYKILVSRRNLNAERSSREIEGKSGKRVYLETFIKSCDYVFTSTLDGSEFVSQGFGEGQDTSGGDKSASMATSNSYKYVIFEMFSIATEDQNDSDQMTAHEAKLVLEKIKIEFQKLLDEGLTRDKIIKEFGSAEGKDLNQLKFILANMCQFSETKKKMSTQSLNQQLKEQFDRLLASGLSKQEILGKFGSTADKTDAEKTVMINQMKTAKNISNTDILNAIDAINIEG